MTKLMKKYDRLLKLEKEIVLVNSIAETLAWDEQTYMPAAGGPHRAEQLTYLAGKKHNKSTNPEIGELLSELEAGNLSDDKLDAKIVNIREWRRNYDLAVKMPRDLVEELAKTASLAQSAWVKARKKKDFSLFEPWLAKTIKLKLLEADAIGHSGDRYDALLDQFEPGAKTSEVATVLRSLGESIVPILEKVKNSNRKPNRAILRRDYAINIQEKFGREIAKSIGYDFKRGSLDVTTHPFCTTLGPNDTRITTRYDTKYLNSALFGIIHEAGHGIYDQNLPSQHWGTPMGSYVSYSVHESQSRMWENIVGRSKAFWKFWFPVAKNMFSSLNDTAFDDFYFAINEVRPSFIRVEADELTYNLHIFLRFEIERAMISGDLQASDVPGAWNEKFRKHFGLDVPDDSAGSMQDVHWSAGLIGYFPTYALGNLMATQLFEKASENLENLNNEFSEGNYSSLLKWLIENVHSQGQRYRANDLIKKVTGNPLDSKPSLNYMQKKFFELYNID